MKYVDFWVKGLMYYSYRLGVLSKMYDFSHNNKKVIYIESIRNYCLKRLKTAIEKYGTTKTQKTKTQA